MFDEPEGGTTLIPLLDRLAAGDTSAVDEIIAHSMEWLKVLAHKRLMSFPVVKSQHQTDDIVQGAALRLYRALKAVTPESVGHFMRLAAEQIRRELFDLKRRILGVKGGRVQVVLDPAQSTSQVGQVFDRPDPDAKSKERRREQLQEIDELVDNLPEDQREVFLQVFYHGLAYGDVVRVLGISESTVKRRWYDAQDTLHRLLQGSP